MNEKIKQLLAQAHLEVENIKDTNKIAEKFAELIIRECVKIADERQFKHRNNYPISIAIEEHFGIE